MGLSARTRAPCLDGWFVPAHVRDAVLAVADGWTEVARIEGRPAAVDEAGAVAARWPRLGSAAWSVLLEGLEDARRALPAGRAYWERLGSALSRLAGEGATGGEAFQDLAPAVATYTGFSRQMIEFAPAGFDPGAVEALARAYAEPPTWAAARAWQPYAAGAGWVRFIGPRAWRGVLRPASTIHGAPLTPGRIVGYASGNVPGTALLITLLALATALAGSSPPVVIVRNSRREPLFSSRVLHALERVDPETVSTVAVLVWEYADPDVRARVLPEADLAVAAASDPTIEVLRTEFRAAGLPPGRIQAHGHKVSFALVAREAFGAGLDGLQRWAEAAALDSILWDQFGCLNARLHFVEERRRGDAEDYAQALAEALRYWARRLPRGAWPLHRLQERFDRYKALEGTGSVRVTSGYGEPFFVAVDRRALEPWALHDAVNACEGRAVIVRPVTAEALAERELAAFAAPHLQSLAFGPPRAWSRLQGALERAALRGVTAVRPLGRGALPVLAESWDGWLPLDWAAPRPPGRFATVVRLPDQPG